MNRSNRCGVIINDDTTSSLSALLTPIQCLALDYCKLVYLHASMEVVSRSPSLNPASTPFFPGGGGGPHAKEDDHRGLGLGFSRRNSREQFGASSTSLSISPTEYRSVKSSPSPQQDGSDGRGEPLSEYRPSGELSRQAPAITMQETERGYPTLQRGIARESSMSAIMEIPPDSEETPGTATANGSFQHHTFYANTMGRIRDRLSTPPVVLDCNTRPSSFTSGPAHLISSSPASSLDSGSMFASSADLSTSFDAQLRTSPLFLEILERVARNEHATREIQRDLGDVSRKLDILVERSVNANAVPEFRDPFAPSATPSFATPGLGGLSGPRGSIIGNIAPNQPAPNDEISTISHRISSLTTSVDQLLAFHQVNGAGLQQPQLLGQSPQQSDILSRGLAQPPTPNPNVLGHGLPNRPSPRIPGPPPRTWSSGTIDPRGSVDITPGSMGRVDIGFRDKRRSVTQFRRDSVVVRLTTT